MLDFFKRYQIEDEVIAAGVSGGADSLALVLRLKDCGKKVVALTVDHQLRPESRTEAEYVAALMEKHGIEHHILTWEGEKPEHGVETAAREARYDLLQKWCAGHMVQTLAVGHHRRDQAETFLLRLQRGSGLFGLSGILPVSYRGWLRVIRPQLDDSPEELRAYLRERGVKWVEDPSNQCDDYQRVRMRKFLPLLEKESGISETRLAETAAILARTRDYIEGQVARFIKNHVRCWHEKIFSLPVQLLSAQHEELCYRVLAQLIKDCGGAPYTPEAAAVLRLCAGLTEKSFRGCTLGGCEIFKAARRLWIIPEGKQKFVLKKQAWEKCLQEFPQYAKADLPYKTRRGLYLILMKAQNGKE